MDLEHRLQGDFKYPLCNLEEREQSFHDMMNFAQPNGVAVIICRY